MAAANYNAAGQAGLAAKIQGLREAKAAFQALPDIVRDRMLAATETTVREIARNAQARLTSQGSVRSGSLLKAVAWRVTASNGRGRVGINNGPPIQVPGSKGRRVSQAYYCWFLERGTKFMAAKPFMLPAAEAEKGPYLDRCMRAGKDIETDVANIGSRTL